MKKELLMIEIEDTKFIDIYLWAQLFVVMFLSMFLRFLSLKSFYTLFRSFFLPQQQKLQCFWTSTWPCDDKKICVWGRLIVLNFKHFLRRPTIFHFSHYVGPSPPLLSLSNAYRRPCNFPASLQRWSQGKCFVPTREEVTLLTGVEVYFAFTLFK